jgi:hypothetical protein
MIQLLAQRVRHLAGCRVCRQRLLTGSPRPIELYGIQPVLPVSAAGEPYIPDEGALLDSELRAA